MLRVFGMIAGVAAGVGGMSLASSASAATGKCSFGADDKAFYVELSSVAANDANNVLCMDGQPSYAGPEPIKWSAFGMTYTLAYKSDEAGKGDGHVTFTNFMLDENTDDIDWAISQPADVASVVIGIKQKNHYSAFMVDSTSGFWGVFEAQKEKGPKKDKGPQLLLSALVEDNGFKRTNDYSHVDIWYKKKENGDDNPPPAPIPLPAAGWMLLAALGGTAGLRRFRKAR